MRLGHHGAPSPKSELRLRTPSPPSTVRGGDARAAVAALHAGRDLRGGGDAAAPDGSSSGGGAAGVVAFGEDDPEAGGAGRAQLRVPRRSVDVQRDLARRVHAAAWLPVADPAPDAKPIEPAYGGSFLKESRVRATWLLGLLVLQSLSSFVLEANEALIKDHLVVTLFLTMLVGAGGNSGAQSAVHVIRGLATGQFACTLDAYVAVLQQQLRVGLLLGTALAVGGYVRVVVTEGVPLDAVAIAGSLFCIVNSSVLVGTSLPFALAWRGVDPAHAGTTVQVVMDVAGVAITCAVCRLMLTTAATTSPSAVEALSQAAAAAGDLVP